VAGLEWKILAFSRRYEAHSPVMDKIMPIQLLEVSVFELNPTKWKWQVWSRDAEIAYGIESSRETAQISGDGCLFNLLSKGWRGRRSACESRQAANGLYKKDTAKKRN
jgi:hypothetical protein